MNNFIEKTIKILSSLDKEKLNILKQKIINSKGKIIILGNGGSNAIASHMAEDYTKALGKISLSFSDAPRLTCYANDYGYDRAFLQFLKEFVEKESLVILISSSGNSKNIVNCAEYCLNNSIDFIGLSGFSEQNALKRICECEEKLHFWVDSNDYGIVECTHEIILHSVI